MRVQGLKSRVFIESKEYRVTERGMIMGPTNGRWKKVSDTEANLVRAQLGLAHVVPLEPRPVTNPRKVAPYKYGQDFDQIE